MVKEQIKYKKTALDWMPEVPQHWQVRRVKSFCDFINRGNTPKYVEKSEFKVVNQATFSKGYWDESKIRYSDFGEKNLKGAIQKNDILLASTGGGVLGKVWFYEEDANNHVADSHVTILRDSQKRFSPKFLFYFLSINYTLINGILSEGSTNQTELQKDWLLSLKLALPPKAEQDEIVQQIKTIEEKINHFTRSKQRFIELLHEQKQSIINRIVVEGIPKLTGEAYPEKSKVKSSGLDWLEKIPAHWEMRRCKNVFYELDVRSTNGEEELLSVSHYDGVRKRSEKNVFMFKAEDYTGYKLCWAGDLVINIMWAWMGALGISKEHGIVSSAYGVYRLKNSDDYDSEFLDFLFRNPGYILEYTKRSKGVHSSRARMYSDEFFNILILTPPIKEQKEIVEHIKAETKTIDITITKAEREIELIKEYKEVMISEAVMGKRITVENLLV